MEDDDLWDKITLIGELEHARRHLRLIAPESKTDEEESLRLTWAKNLREMRRTIMQEMGIEKEYWCYFKSLCIIRQLLLEVEWEEAPSTAPLDLLFIEDLIRRVIGTEDVDQCSECNEKKEEENARN